MGGFQPPVTRRNALCTNLLTSFLTTSWLSFVLLGECGTGVPGVFQLQSWNPSLVSGKEVTDVLQKGHSSDSLRTRGI